MKERSDGGDCDDVAEIMGTVVVVVVVVAAAAIVVTAAAVSGVAAKQVVRFVRLRHKVSNCLVKDA